MTHTSGTSTLDHRFIALQLQAIAGDDILNKAKENREAAELFRFVDSARYRRLQASERVPMTNSWDSGCTFLSTVHIVGWSVKNENAGHSLMAAYQPS